MNIYTTMQVYKKNACIPRGYWYTLTSTIKHMYIYNLQCYKNCTYIHSKSHVFVHWYTFDCSTHNRLFLGTLSKNSIHTLGLYRRYQEEYVLVRLQSGGSFVSANGITKTLSFHKEQFCPYAIHNIFYNRHELVICVHQCYLVQREF